MKAPKHIGELAEKYLKLQKETRAAYKALADWLTNEAGSADGVYIDDIFITDEPHGQLQNEDEYCDQWTGYCEDSFSGTYYHPIEGTDKYLAFGYSS